MKRYLCILLVLLLGVSAAGCGRNAGGATPEGASDEIRLVTEGTLTVATEASFPPYEMEAADGEGIAHTGLRGIDIEIAAAVAEKLGLELKVENLPFDEALLSVRNGKTDLVLAAIFPSPELERYLLLSEPYVTSVQVVLAQEDSEVDELSDLKEAKIGVVRDTTAWIFSMENYSEKQYTVYDSCEAAVRALLDGEVEALILDEAPAKTLLQRHDGLVILEKNYAEQEYVAGVSKDNPALRQAVDQALKELDEEGVIDRIVGRYITADTP